MPSDYLGKKTATINVERCINLKCYICLQIYVGKIHPVLAKKMNCFSPSCDSEDGQIIAYHSDVVQLICRGSVPVSNQETAASVPRQRLYRQFDLTINLNSHAVRAIDHKYIHYI